MKIVIDSNDLVKDDVALRMIEKIASREDGEVNFTQGLKVTVKTTKTQRSFVITKE